MLVLELVFVDQFVVSRWSMDETCVEKLMPENMSEGNPNEDEKVDRTDSGPEEEGDMTMKKPPVTGSRLWDRVRSSLLKPKV